MSDRAAIAISGAPPPNWDSLRRTFRYYESAIERSAEFRVAKTPIEYDQAACELVFRLDDTHDQTLGRGRPKLIALHGSVVLDRSLISGLLSRLRQCDAVIVNCASDANILKQIVTRPAPLILTLPFGTSITRSRDGTNGLLRRALNIPQESKIALFVGRLIPHKQVHVFLDILASLRKTINLVGLVIGDHWDDYDTGMVGSTYRKFLCKKVAQSRLKGGLYRLTGGFSDDDLRMFYSGSDLLIHPSLTLDENYGYVPVEAIACGTPVVTTSFGGMKDTVRHGITGLLARTWVTDAGPRGDFSMMYRHAERVLSNRKLNEQMSLRCTEEGKRFITQARGDALIDGIKEVLKRYRHGAHKKGTTRRLPRLSSDCRWTFLDGHERIIDTKESIAEYVSASTAPKLDEFRAIGRFGRHVFGQDTLTVSDPIAEFRGNVSRKERLLLESLRPGWTDAAQFSGVEVRLVNRLLATGVLVGTAASV